MALIGSPPPIRDIYEAHSYLLESMSELRRKYEDLREEMEFERSLRKTRKP